MHIFLVNDDGIGAKGIMALLREATARGHRVSMCAPRTQQSAASHRFTLTEPLYVNDYPLTEPNAVAYSISGSPVDCVRIGLQHLIKEPVDVLISGINDGYNAGVAVHYSGTVGAAMEGALNHLPAIATSIHHESTQDMLENLAKLTITLAETYATKQVPPCTILNINAPNVEPDKLKPMVYAPLAQGNFLDGYERRESPRAGTYFWLMNGSKTEEPEEGSDQWYLERGHVTLTLMGNPICLESTVFDGLGLL